MDGPRFTTDTPGTSSHPRPACLLDDQSLRWQTGERLPVEGYLERWPDVREDAEQVLDLVYHEILLRQRQGETPSAEEYLQRFPDFEAELRPLLEVHAAVGLDAKLPSTNSFSDFIYPTAKPERSLPAPPMQVAGYEILGELGRGGMGVVYKARQKGLNRTVALKMIRSGGQASAEQVARFRAEAEAVARLRHPNIVQIYEIGDCNGEPFFSLEYIAGGSLAQHLDGAPQPPKLAAALVATLADATQAAHEAGIIHRDLKPANILLSSVAGCHLPIVKNQDRQIFDNREPETGNWQPKVTDFGLAKRLDAVVGNTHTGSLVGTPSYMAPEQASSGEVVGPPTDVYALGAILYELLTGRPPFRDENPLDTLWQVVNDEPVSPRRLQSKTPRDLETICLKCLAKAPARRYATARELADDLRRFLAGEPIRARAAGPGERAWKWVRRRPCVATGSLFGILLFFAIVTVHEIRLNAAVEDAQAKALRAEDHKNRVAMRAELSNGLHQVEGAVNARHWHEAGLRLTALRPAVDSARERFPDDAELQRLRIKVEPLHHQIEARLTDEERYLRLRRCRDDAAFRVTHAGSGDPTGNREHLLRLATTVFDLFPVQAEGTFSVESACYTTRQVEEIKEACFELLMNLADAVAQTPADAADTTVRQAAREALTVLDRADRLGVRSAVWHRRRAAYLERSGEVSAAREERARAGTVPARPYECFLQGVDLFRAGEPRLAIAHLERAVNLQPDHFGAHYALAFCYLKLGEPNTELARARVAAAKASLTTCITQRPDCVWPYLLRGFAHGELDEFDSAAADFRSAEDRLSEVPDEAGRYGLWVNRAVVRLRQRDNVGAIADLTRAIELRPDEYAAHVNLANAYEGRGQVKEAAAQLDSALALAPATARAAVHRTRARLLEAQGELGKAIVELDQALQHEPGGSASVEASGDWYTRGRLLLQQHDYPAALRSFDRSLELLPESAATHRARAQTLSHLDRPKEAIVALDRALEAEGIGSRTLSAARLERARARAHVGDLAGAAEDYGRVLDAEPQNATARAERAWAYLAVAAPTLAERDFEAVLTQDPTSADALAGRGLARVKGGPYRSALKDAEAALRLREPSPRVLYSAACTFAQAAVRIEEETPAPDAQTREQRRKHQERALALLSQAVDRMPAEQRVGFWQRTVQTDLALAPLRRDPAFARLAEQVTGTERQR